MKTMKKTAPVSKNLPGKNNNSRTKKTELLKEKQIFVEHPHKRKKKLHICFERRKEDTIVSANEAVAFWTFVILET